MNDVRCDIHNRFDFEIIDGKTGEVKRKARAYNVVTNNLWSYLITTNTAFATCIQYGSGSGTPSASDTSLFNRAGGVGVTEISQSVDYVNKLITRVCRIILGLNDAVGVTITEVGMGAGGGDGALTTHAMLQDMNGNPISISKTNTDIINIYATIYCHWSVSSEVILYPKSGFQNTLVGRSNVLGSLTMGFNDDLCGYSNSKTWSKAADLSNKRITYTCPRLSASEGNMNGIVYFMGTGNFDGIAIKKGTNAWNKFTITNESVGTGDGETTKFKTKFNYPYNATVYVNGVAQSNVEVKCMPISNGIPEMPVDAGLSNAERIIYCPVQDRPRYEMVVHNELLAQGASISEMGGYTNTTWGYIAVYGSNDCVEWTSVAGTDIARYNNGWAVIPVESRNYKYYKAVVSSYESNCNLIGLHIDWDGYNIIFANAPAVGDVITITYDTDCIPKDSDHVLDATFTLQFGEYNE